MPDPQTLPLLVQNRLSDFLSSRSSILARVSDETRAFSLFSREFLSGGKRFRARFCYQGWRSVTGASATASDPIVSAAAALEVFHAAALVHDDIIDNSDTRRGGPSAHRRFEAQHREAEWSGDAAAYGRSSAILLGDLLLGWSDELLDEALNALDDRAAAQRARAEFVRMRTEVTAGQYLDILEEQAWGMHDDAAQLQRAETIAVYKSAKYSVEAPLALGALIAGGGEEQLAALRAYGLPLGVAYQMRDDLLGVFGDERVTGKPSGDDLREGKRTVLIGMARLALPVSGRRLVDELLGDPELTGAQIALLQSTIRDTGAVDRLEERIAAAVADAKSALLDAPLDSSAVIGLSELADAVSRRDY
ncbi:geranylgeranyl diphosphate synthase, type I [Paramicrobacterium humi]|uniref:Geranylgeranyl diphosphate synthase, type I n=1 Tax=Paramicrobacterium humi TaxID=640635 RepID=A0A1H4TVQ8_9MICO|nr:polyprenyl synthetase family protein [Microbacterium humi]SEC60360.1 geranylgeranyl diphosphate synthase, type I [Microbacterium humi]